MYVTMNQPCSSTLEPKRVNFLQDNIPILKFMQKFQSHTYKCIKHSHRSKWKAFKFKYSCKVFKLTTILSVVEFANNYTFYFQREIQSEYYHLNQVSIFIHVFQRHAQVNFDGSNITPESCDVTNEYHFYISDDYEHDTLFIQHFFILIYESFRKNKISFTKHWIELYGCARKFKFAHSF